MTFRIEKNDAILHGRRPDLIEGEIVEIPATGGEATQFPNGLIIINTPLVKMGFDPKGEWPFKRIESDVAFCSAVTLLDKITKLEISELEIRSVALLLHERFIYAKTWRQSRGLLRNSKSKPVVELKKLRRLALQPSWERYFEAFRKSSFFVKDLLAEKSGDFVYPMHAALSSERVIAAVDQALADPRMKTRPREFELDRCASTLLSVYERFTDKKLGLANDSMTGKPISALHRFVRDYGLLYGIELVTDDSDGRLEKMLKNRTEFGIRDYLIIGESGTKYL
jgi:hypothetical protein